MRLWPALGPAALRGRGDSGTRRPGALEGRELLCWPPPHPLLGLAWRRPSGPFTVLAPPPCAFCPARLLVPDGQWNGPRPGPQHPALLRPRGQAPQAPRPPTHCWPARVLRAQAPGGLRRQPGKGPPACRAHLGRQSTFSVGPPLPPASAEAASRDTPRPHWHVLREEGSDPGTQLLEYLREAAHSPEPRPRQFISRMEEIRPRAHPCSWGSEASGCLPGGLACGPLLPWGPAPSPPARWVSVLGVCVLRALLMTAGTPWSSSLKGRSCVQSS